MKLSINAMIILVALAATGILIFQVNWLRYSYKISSEKIALDVAQGFDKSISIHKKEVTDTVRMLLKKLIRPTNIGYKGHHFPSYNALSYKSNGGSSYYSFEVSYKELTEADKTPYVYLLKIIDKVDLHELKGIYYAMLGHVNEDVSPQGKLLNQLRLSLEKTYKDIATLTQILNTGFVKEGLDFKGKVTYFNDLTEVSVNKSFNGPIPSSDTSTFLNASAKKPLTTMLNELNAHVKKINGKGDVLFIAKPLLDDVDDIQMGKIPVLLLTVQTPSSLILKKMMFAIVGSGFLFMLIGASLAYMFYAVMKQKKLSEIKNDFISNMSHELKTPLSTTLAAVQGLLYFEVLKDDNKTKLYLNTAESEIKRLSQMINEILNSSIFEQPGFNLNCVVFNLKVMLKEIISVQQTYSNKSVKITLNYNAMEDIFADKIHLHHVFVNVLDNAVKYNGSEVNIVITCTINHHGIEIQICDNGIGIPKAYQKNIFDKFFRVPDKMGHNVKGHGLGLNYVKNIIEKHKGTIKLKRSDNSGSIFIITLPQ